MGHDYSRNTVLKMELSPYAEIEGVRYLFGVPEINAAKQKNLITQAGESYEDDFEPSSGRMCGSCGLKMVAPYAPYVNHLCINCTSLKLCEARLKFRAGIMLVQFGSLTGSDNDDNSVVHSGVFDVRIVGESCIEISKRNGPVVTVNCYYERADLTEVEDVAKYSQWTAIVREKVEYKGVFLSGFYGMRIAGNYVCVNHISGKGCASFDQKEGFSANTVPSGYSGWTEKHDKGLVIIYPYCYMCSRKRNEESGDETPAERLKKMSIARSEYANMSKDELIGIILKRDSEIRKIKKNH
jgi:hypothetical protein